MINKTIIIIENESILISLALSIILMVFGLWLGKVFLYKYKLKTFNDIRGFGVAIASILGGLYLLIDTLWSL
ncbi:hypothetical protein C1H87_05645 [Flavivirga eckloniae]|uniref:Uncharacterized protein n=1 Tax=Flavivirga eckloniae TaxID=1803846 RepID=A0A2K9PMD3_9FLAO|nr:hypothetical protein C1H87_05645 [Flavivirga eckloniae]